MPKTNLRSMSVEQLMQLRDDVGKELNRKAVELRDQLARLGGEVGPSRGRGGSALRGKKVPPKYRSPSGETWAGIGTGQAILGQAGAQGRDGWSQQSRKEKDLKIF